MPISEETRRAFSEQDTADKLILPYLNRQHGFPPPESLDYQAQHTLPIEEDRTGRYDGLYLHGGYPYAVLEAKKYAHDLTDQDYRQARNYALTSLLDEPVPFIIVSNGREHRFYKKSTELDLEDQRIAYQQIPEVEWQAIVEEEPGKVKILLTTDQLLQRLKSIKDAVYRDIRNLFFDLEENEYDVGKCPPLKDTLEKIILERKIYVGTASDKQKQIDWAIQTIALHFTIKVLFIKIIEDLSSGADTPRIIHDLFPREEYNHMGGVFGYKVLNALRKREKAVFLRLYVKSKKFYSQLGKDISKVGYQDIFRYGFNVHMVQYGKILKAENYDRFFPSDETLKQIHDDLITIDIRNALIYASTETRSNVIGDIYANLIDRELRDSIGAVYTPDDTVDFMVALAEDFLGGFRRKKVVENACGSGHFYRQIYRKYVNEVVEEYRNSGNDPDYRQAHSEALEHVLGRDIDPFAIQLTILAVFLEQLKDNVKAITLKERTRNRVWKANFYIDCQNSLDPITIKPDDYFGFIREWYKSLDLDNPKSVYNSCKKALAPDLIIGNPPYGVKVVKGTHYDDIYSLKSKDSYGYFIANAIERLPDGKRVIFITSSSFLTIKSHFKLRDLILGHCKIIRILKLHRSTFPGIDIFPVIIELEKESSHELRDAHFYQFYDLWQLHPVSNRDELREIYDYILLDLLASTPWPFDRKRINRYTSRQGLINNCTLKPIFDGSPSLFDFMFDFEKKTDPVLTLRNLETGTDEEFRVKVVNEVAVIKLKEIAQAKVGLQTGNNTKYLRKRHGSTERYQEVQSDLIKELETLTEDEKENGIVLSDPNTDPHFIAYDKAGTVDIEGKRLNNYYYPLEYFIDWSDNAIQEMKSSSGARFQNSYFYFREGLSFSDTGIYSPMFRLSHGSVFDQKASCIFSDYFSREFLLGVLCSKLVKYFVKIFINHSVSSQVDSIKEIPFAIPTDDQRRDIENIVIGIIDHQMFEPSYDYHGEQQELDAMVYQLYNLNEIQISEVDDWYDRRYPKLRRDIDTEEVEEG